MTAGLGSTTTTVEGQGKSRSVPRAGLWAFLVLNFITLPLFAWLFMLTEDWGGREAYAFTCTIVSTVGFGNISPMSDEGKLVVMAAGCTGIPLVLLFLQWIGAILMFIIEGALSLVRSKIFRLEKPPSKVEFELACFCFILFFCLQAVVVYHELEREWSWLESAYFVFNLGTTIGLGDFVPAVHESTLYLIYHCFNSSICLAVIGMIVQLESAYWNRGLEAAHATIGRRAADGMTSVRSLQAGAHVQAKERLHRFFRRHDPELHSDPLWQEMVRTTRKIMSKGTSLDMVFEMMDKQGDGKLDREEFVAVCREVLCLPQERYPDTKLMWAFDCLDTDESGALELVELAMFLESQKTFLTSGQTTRLLDDLPEDGFNGENCAFCGNTYMKDSVFCRKCGKEREHTTSYVVAESTSRQTSPQNPSHPSPVFVQL